MAAFPAFTPRGEQTGARLLSPITRTQPVATSSSRPTSPSRPRTPTSPRRLMTDPGLFILVDQSDSERRETVRILDIYPITTAGAEALVPVCPVIFLGVSPMGGCPR